MADISTPGIMEKSAFPRNMHHIKKFNFNGKVSVQVIQQKIKVDSRMFYVPTRKSGRTKCGVIVKCSLDVSNKRYLRK